VNFEKRDDDQGDKRSKFGEWLDARDRADVAKLSIFWLPLLRTAIVGFVVIVVAGIGSCQGTRYQTRKMIEHGASPLAAACAIHGGSGATSGSINNCTLLIEREKP